MPISLQGLDGKYVHVVATKNEVPEAGFGDQQNTIQLVEERTNAISIPITVVGGVDSREMQWNAATDVFDVNPGNRTRISEFVNQLNDRYNGGVNDPSVVVRCEAIDAETGNRFVYTPGATVIGSAQDFEVIIPDQQGGFESRGFTLQLATDANSNPGVDGGEVLLRLNNTNLPW